MTMFPMPMPEMPQEFVDLATSNPEGFAEAMGSGMEAMTAALEGGANPADAFDAMGDAMGPLMEDLGISPEAFDAAGDALGAAIGPAMHMAPADASPADMGAMMQDGLDMMLPEGVDCPAPISDAMGDMGVAMGDAGIGAHDVGAEMMGDPGSDTYMLPTDANGGPIVEAGQPETCPGDACQPPPEGGQCDTAAPSMMPPEGGYDHAPMNDDIVMPDPFVMATATDLESNDAGDGGMGALEGDIGGVGTAGMADDGPDQNDVAVGAAIDGATEQGGGIGSGASLGQGFANSGEGEEGNESQEVDPSAGMG